MPIPESKLDQLTHEAVSLLSALIRIPALSREEDQKASYLFDYLVKSGYAPKRTLNNIVLNQSPDATKPFILLNSHIDTVKPVSSWNLNPYDPIQQNGNLFGLGSNDAGASVVSLFMAYTYLISTNQSFNLIYSATAEEEISGQQGIVSILKELPEIQLAVIGEPTGMQMAVAERGLMVIDASCRGVAGHVAREEGQNAIYLAIKDIEKIINYKFDKKSTLLGSTKANVTVIKAGSQHNVVPDQCTFVIDVRTNEMYTNEEVYELLQHATESELNARSFRLKSSHISMDHPVVAKGLEMGLTCYGSPTLSDQPLISYTSIKIGPGQSSRSHTADEYIEIEEIRNGIKTYIELLDGLNI